MTRLVSTRNPAAPVHVAAPVQPVEVLALDLCRTARLTLRPLREGDRSSFMQVVRRDRDYLSRGINVHRPGETLNACFDRLLFETEAGEQKGNAWRRALVDERGAFAGMVQLLDIRRGLTWSADAGWWIASAFAGRGLATEAVQAMVDLGLTDYPRGLGLHEVRAAIGTRNGASRRVAAKTGFVLTPDAVTSVCLCERWEMHELWLARVSVEEPGAAG